jgi:hypothetical protein
MDQQKGLENDTHSCSPHPSLPSHLPHSLDHHTSFSARDPTEALSNINTRLAQGHVSLMKAKHVFLTLGTAHAYVLVPKEGEEGGREEGRIVANCHRLPAGRFRRELLGKGNVISEKDFF